ncbi:DUF3955 domain-containing protein [Mycoplasma sp. P36-A1]|uniref:DUF3955 domain-containing protein n=1 Tax=Mycoplasma sp. P36-A1 TaxID=3252900 RepID=UPI003C2F6EA7
MNDFGSQIKSLRVDNDLTQEQMANILNVSRQAVSNWENNKNLPDLETIILIANYFAISLDELILKDKTINNLTKKLIDDGNENKKAKLNLISLIIGFALLILGVISFIIKSISVEYIDAQGILHENFFLIIIGYIFIFSGLITFLIIGIKNIKNIFIK